MTAFRPKGDLAEWRTLYDFLRQMSVGEIARYDALGELLGRSFNDEGARRNPLERARRELEQEDHRTLMVVRNIGYRVVDGPETMSLAKGHHARSRRQVAKAKQKLDSTNLRTLTPDERERWEAMQTLTSHHLLRERHLARRITAIEKVLDSVRKA